MSIVARALGIAAVGEIENATGLADPGDAIIVDGATGDVHAALARHGGRLYRAGAVAARRQLQYLRCATSPAYDQDGEKISLMINAGLAVDLPHIEETGAAGIGLFRTELQFMVAATFPHGRAALPRRARRRQRQASDLSHPRHRRRQGAALYAQCRGENPHWLACHQARPDRPGLLRSQIRAMLRAPAGAT
jgi:phosphotransferase system enzyme I (PtsP)